MNGMASWVHAMASPRFQPPPHRMQISHTRQGVGEPPISQLQRFVQEVSHIPDEFGLLVVKEMVCLRRHDLLRSF